MAYKAISSSVEITLKRNDVSNTINTYRRQISPKMPPGECRTNYSTLSEQPVCQNSRLSSPIRKRKVKVYGCHTPYISLH